MKQALRFTTLGLVLLACTGGCGGGSHDTTSSGTGGTGGAGGSTGGSVTSTGGTGATGGTGTGGSTGGTGGSGGTGTGGSGACTDYKGQGTTSEIALSPFADAEAEVLALEASGEIVAPKHVYERIVSDLAAIRGQHPAVQNVKAMVSWAPGDLLMGFDGEGMAAVEAGTYTDWDCPNAHYGYLNHQVSSFVLVHFSHRLNVPLLAAEYALLPHVAYAEPNGLIGDGNDVCVAIEGETKYYYVFDEGSGDCPAGCITHLYRGFSTEGSPVTVTPLGSFSNGDPPPAWFNALNECTKWL